MSTVSIWTVVIWGIAAVAIALFTWAKTRINAAERAKDSAVEGGIDALKKANAATSAAAAAHNEAVQQANADKEAINAQASADSAALHGTTDDGLSLGAAAIAASIKRANGGL